MARKTRFLISPSTTVMLPKVADPRIPEELPTARLLLRRWRSSDLDSLAQMFAQPEVWEFPFARGLTREETELRLSRYIETWEHDGFGKYAVELSGDGPLIGCVGLELETWFHEIEGEVEIGWRLDPRYWGDGYATEAALASLKVGFDRLGLDRIVAVVEPANLASLRLAEKIGLRVVRETLEPKFGRLLEVFVVEREIFEEATGSQTAVEDGLHSAKVLDTTTRAH